MMGKVTYVKANIIKEAELIQHPDSPYTGGRLPENPDYDIELEKRNGKYYYCPNYHQEDRTFYGEVPIDCVREICEIDKPDSPEMQREKTFQAIRDSLRNNRDEIVAYIKNETDSEKIDKFLADKMHKHAVAYKMGVYTIY